MEIFISWSGDASKAVAEALREWLGYVIQAVRPWMSEADIDKGARWGSEMARHLADCQFGIICLTPDNVTAPWILFEAGALSKTLKHSHVCPYLLGLVPTDLTGPLAQFQAARAVKADTKRLLRTINRALGDDALPEEKLNKAFEMLWPGLERELDSIHLDQHDAATGPRIAEREMIEEVLMLVRRVARFELGMHPGPESEPQSGMFSSFTKKELEDVVKALDLDLPTKPRTVAGWRLMLEEWFRNAAASRPQLRLQDPTADGEVILGLMHTLMDRDLELPSTLVSRLWPYGEAAIASSTSEEDAVLLLVALYVMMTSGRDPKEELRRVVSGQFSDTVPGQTMA